MQFKTWLKHSIVTLQKAGVATSRLDCLVLAEDMIGQDRSYLLAHPEYLLAPELIDALTQQLERRARHEPLAYIRGKSEFYGREFLINKAVLEPRPESETMITLLKQLVNSRQLTANSPLAIADVGTGSGAIGITAALEIPNLQVFLLDIDEGCLKIAGSNAGRHSVKIQLLQGDLLSPLLSTVNRQLSAILANLPYVPNGFTINEAAKYEPRLAIFGGVDGLDLYRKLFRQISKLPRRPEFVLTESLPAQHAELLQIAKSNDYDLQDSEDFIQTFIKI